MHFKISISIILCFFLVFVDAQNFSKLDRYALKTPENISTSLPELTNYLTSQYNDDLEKVRSIFTWIVHNVDYDNSAYKKSHRRLNRSTNDILKRRKAICIGYAQLFREMCLLSNISAEIVDGYVKNVDNQEVDLTEISHAWNAVKIDTSWYLLDITWASGNDHSQMEYYFLTSPEELITSHLPADPLWQLLDCPVPTGVFQKPKPYIVAYLKNTQPCFNYKDSLDSWLQMSFVNRNLKTAINSHKFNPVKANQGELGHSYMDIVSMKIDRAAALELTDSVKAIKEVNLEIVTLTEKAKEYIDLYDNQKENLAYAHYSYAVALSKELSRVDNPSAILKEMTIRFNKAKEILSPLPKNIFVETALLQINGNLEWIANY